MADSYVYKGAKNIGQASLIQQIKMNESYLVKGIDTTLTAKELQVRNQAAKSTQRRHQQDAQLQRYGGAASGLVGVAPG